MASIDSGFATPPRRPQLRIDVPKHEPFCEPPSFMVSPATPNGTPLSADKAELRRRLLIKRSPSSNSAPASPFVPNGDQPFAPCFTASSYLSPSKPSTPRAESQYTTSPPGSPIGEATSLLNDTPFDFIKSDYQRESYEKELVLSTAVSRGETVASEELDNDAASVLMDLWHSPPPMGSPAIYSGNHTNYRSLSSLSTPLSPIASASSSLSSLKRSASFDHFDDESDFVAHFKHGNKKDNRIPNSCESHKRRHLRCPIDCPERKRRETSSSGRRSTMSGGGTASLLAASRSSDEYDQAYDYSSYTSSSSPRYSSY